jgi:hypothetical protein
MKTLTVDIDLLNSQIKDLMALNPKAYSIPLLKIEEFLDTLRIVLERDGQIVLIAKN